MVETLERKERIKNGDIWYQRMFDKKVYLEEIIVERYRCIRLSINIKKLSLICLFPTLTWVNLHNNN